MFLNKIDNTAQFPIISPPKDNKSPISALWSEILAKIFSLTNLPDLSAIPQVSKKWDEIINGKPSPNNSEGRAQPIDPYLHKKVIYLTAVFGNQQWAQCGGEELIKEEDMEEEFQSFSDFVDMLMTSHFVDQKISALSKNAVIVRIPKSLTEKILGILAKPYFPCSDKNGYACLSPLDKMKEYSKASYWVMIANKIIPGSDYAGFSVQQQMASNLGYETPRVLEVVACLFANYCLSETYLYEKTWIRCQDKILDRQAMAGLGPTGIEVYPEVEFAGFAGIVRSKPTKN